MSTVAALPRVCLVLEPTPLHRAPRLSAELGVPILFKRDDLTGAGLGGNKLRGLEYLIADAQQQGCDCLVTGAGPQSNWTLLAALACLRFDLEPHIVCYGPAATDEGNMRLHRWLGVDVRFTGDPARASVDTGIVEVAAELRAAGRQPYVVPRGGATPLGALGYVRATAEIAEQISKLGIDPTALWLATGSCGTQAGLVAGASFTGARFQVTGVTVSRPAAECRARIQELAAGTVALAAGTVGVAAGTAVLAARPDASGSAPGLSDRAPNPGTARVLDGWLGPGYGIPSAEGEAAARLVARTEGVFLDPTFGAKAMAALIAECRAGQAYGPQLFLVSGGAPTLFATAKAGGA
ncbi:MAG TPA: pyridoxal-phosphate dependent enzyme [Streptosporangiaceae bacterium]|nr:pyridoxal-phosphate dependent enzyme [Streptosporangiaceae bacterium]